MSDGHPHGFLYDDGTMTDLGTPPAGYSTYAYGKFFSWRPGGRAVGERPWRVARFSLQQRHAQRYRHAGRLVVYGLRHEKRRRGSGRFIHADA